MTLSDDTPGPLIASGRAADVFDIGDGKVLRRYRTPHDVVAYETRVMRFMFEQARAGRGARVPEVFDLRPTDDPSRDIVMERIDGVTMLDDVEQRPWKVVSHANLLARLQRQINDVVAPEWMVTPTTAAAAKRRDDSVLHLDLHPMNVMLTSEGPVVIDWTNASGGPAGFDAALTFVVISTFEVSGLRDQLGQRLFAAAFKRARGSGKIDAFTGAACDHRLADVGITPGERANVGALRKRVTVNRTG
ncbi:MAG: tRNA A-37 threonylcarbamoyl transferase component Bud32 [Ilumatobacter sp.]|jgi:tRNA A-37 threonylcarbamoyl transferase component Bud32